MLQPVVSVRIPDPDGSLVDDWLTRAINAPASGLHELAGLGQVLLHRVRRAASGGKLVRARLVLDVHRLLGGVRHEAALEVAGAFELLHTGFLLHDDVIDGDWVRRGRPNLPAIYRDEHQGIAPVRVGTAAGVVAGDLALHLAHRALARAGAALPGAMGARLQAEFSEAVVVTAIGELADVIDEGAEGTSEARSEEISFAKTAAYSFAGPLRTAGVLAESDETVLAALGRFGSAAGTAFQIRDDLLGVFGEPASTGKSVLGDLLLGKASLLMAHARSSGAGAEVTEALASMQHADGPERIRALLERVGSRAHCERRVEQLRADAVAALRDVPPTLREHLVAFAGRTSFRAR